MRDGAWTAGRNRDSRRGKRGSGEPCEGSENSYTIGIHLRWERDCGLRAHGVTGLVNGPGRSDWVKDAGRWARYPVSRYAVWKGKTERT